MFCFGFYRLGPCEPLPDHQWMSHAHQMSSTANPVNLLGHHLQQPNELQQQQQLPHQQQNHNNTALSTTNTTTPNNNNNNNSIILSISNNNSVQLPSSQPAAPATAQQQPAATTATTAPVAHPQQLPPSGVQSQAKIMNAVASAVACPPAASKKIRRKSDNKVSFVTV